MFIKINFRHTYEGNVSEVITSNPEDAFLLISVLDKSDKIIVWNMENYLPEDFGWAKSENWNKFKKNLFGC